MFVLEGPISVASGLGNVRKVDMPSIQNRLIRVTAVHGGQSAVVCVGWAGHVPGGRTDGGWHCMPHCPMQLTPQVVSVFQPL